MSCSRRAFRASICDRSQSDSATSPCSRRRISAVAILMMVQAVIAWQGETLQRRQEPWLSRIDSLAGIRAWRDLQVSVMRRRECRGGCQIGSLASELSDLDPAARSDLAATFQVWISAFRDGLQAMQDRGELRADADVDQLACALLAARPPR